ncbi:unnamed protein product [Anisakis simplex]|uniref:NADPH--cytochrome P450 reductase n=1 Tax=Anisakis simplex TaxID=6269 RepID=A0A0M3JZ72_ANISI|nr:unnamed protein product [Anisakis simplex]
MIEWLAAQLDTMDVVVVSVVMLGTIYFLFLNKFNKTTSTNRYSPQFITIDNHAKTSSTNSSTSNAIRKDSCLVDTSFIARMQTEQRQIEIYYNLQVLIMYGSQTGTAEELAGRLSKDLKRYGIKALLIDPEEVDVEDFARIPEVNDLLLVLCMATYGEGDPTDNAQQLHEYINNNDCNLSGVRYAVFGLGNKTYEHYNEMGKYFDRRLEELGAKRVHELGLGDDDGNLEEDFMRWREGFWPAVVQSFGWQISEEAGCERQYRFEVVDNPSNTTLFCGEYGRLGSFEKQRPPFDQKNPYLSAVRVNRELHKPKSDRSCRHIEFNTNSARVRYETGDHLGVFPTNDVKLVDEIGRLLNADMDLAFRLINTDEESSKRYPFPCPCTVRTALTHYVDICAPVKSHILKALAEYTSDDEQKQQLILLSTANEQGLKEYSRFIQKERRSIVDVLRHFSTCRPPIDFLLELLPRLQARYYSISSSPKQLSDAISITAVVTRYTIGDRLIKGVCTNYLTDKNEGDKVPIFVRKSTMRLPHRHTTAVIMIGPGTGFAPFRGFIQERHWHKQQGKQIGPMILYFGCRHPEQDYIYEEELNEYLKEGTLSELHVAFSRLTDKKVYVQNQLWEDRETIWKAVDGGAHIYVCGDARNMARDVQNTFVKIFVEIGGKTLVEAQKLQKDLERQRRYQADVWS